MLSSVIYDLYRFPDEDKHGWSWEIRQFSFLSFFFTTSIWNNDRECVMVNFKHQFDWAKGFSEAGRALGVSLWGSFWKMTEFRSEEQAKKSNYSWIGGHFMQSLKRQCNRKREFTLSLVRKSILACPFTSKLLIILIFEIQRPKPTVTVTSLNNPNPVILDYIHLDNHLPHISNN